MVGAATPFYGSLGREWGCLGGISVVAHVCMSVQHAAGRVKVAGESEPVPSGAVFEAQRPWPRTAVYRASAKIACVAHEARRRRWQELARTLSS